MTRIICRLFLCLLLAVGVVTPAFSQTFTTSWKHNSGTFIWNPTTGTDNWTVWWPDTAGATAYVTNTVTSGQMNIVYGDINQQFHELILSSGGGAGTTRIIVTNNHFHMNFGTVSGGGIIEIANAASMTWYRGGRINSSGTVIISGGGTFRYQGSVNGTLEIAGSLVGGSAGGTAFFHTHEFGGTGNANVLVVSGGNIIANAGTFFFETRDAFDNGGLRIAAGGQLTVNANATFILARSANAWDNGPRPTNSGTIFMGGGTLTTARDGTVSRTMRIVNASGGVIQGSGTLAFELVNNGSVIASNGTLNITNVASGSTGTWVAKNGGTLSFRNSADLSGGNISIAGNWLAVTNGNTVTLSSSFRSNDGTLIAGSSGGSATFLMGGNVGGLVQFTNSATGVLTGRGTFDFGYGSGQNNYGLVNEGTIAVGFFGAGDLAVHTRTAQALSFSNAPTGTVVIQGGRAFRVARDASAWTASGTHIPVNAGTFILDNGTFQTADATALNASRRFINSGTIFVRTGGGTWEAGLENRGTIFVTNNNAVFHMIGTTLLTNTATGNIFLGGINDAVGTMRATNVGTFINLGRMEGRGTLIFGRVPGDTAGANASFVNMGVLVATNYGFSGQGTLHINTGNAFSDSGFGNREGGAIYVGTNMTLVLNRTPAAWTGSALVTNAGTIFLQGGTFATSADGVTDAVAARTNLNVGTIMGWGNFNMIVSNGTGGQVLADARQILNRNQGTLTVTLISFTNNLGATVGSIGTNSWLNLNLPGGGNTLVNFGTVQFSAGNILINGGAGIISNHFAIAGVGDISALPIVQVGTSASLIAKDPTDGKTALIATVGPTNLNGQLLGAINSAELQLTVSGGGNAIVNRGTMTIQNGGTITIGGATGIISNDVGGIFFGSGTNQNTIVSVHPASTILASNGLLRVGLADNLNRGTLEAFSSVAMLQLTNAFLLNQGTMKANGGTIDLTGSIITNEGTIQGAGNYPDSIINASGGFIIADGGVMNLGTASAEILNQLGGVIRVTAGTLSVAAASWNNAGVITNAAGATVNRDDGETLTGVLTNSGVIVNAGRFAVQVVNSGNITNSGQMTRSFTNAAGGFVFNNVGTFTGSTVRNQLGATILSAGGTFESTVANFINAGTFKGTNLDVYVHAINVANTGTMIGGGFSGSINSTIIMTNLFPNNFVNQGTMILESPVGGSTNLAFFIMRTSGGTGDFTNNAGGLIQGAGFFKTATGVSGDRNFTIWNRGSIVATNGALILQPLDAFGNGGFVNLGGSITVAAGSTFGIQRTDNAWVNSGEVPYNTGTIQLNGGSFTFYGSGLALANDRSLSNAPTARILGIGTISAGIINAGTIHVNEDGTLRVNVGGGQPSSANLWGIKNLGTIIINTNGILALNRTAADWLADEGLNNSGTLRLQGGQFVTLIGGTVGLATNFLSASGTGGIYGHGTFSAALDAQGGTISAEGGTLTIVGPVMANTGGAATFQAIGTGNVLRFLTNATFVSASTLKANSGGEILMVGGSSANNKTISGVLDNTGGSLVVTGGHTVFLANSANRLNSGTMAVGGAAGINYGQVGGAFTNAGTVRTIAGTSGGTLTGTFGTDNFAFINTGTLIASSGATLTIDPRNAYSAGGFSNTASGRIIVEDGAHFIVSRTSTAWTDTDPSANREIKNMGTITMQGGTFATFQTGGTAFTVNRDLFNLNTIEGYGTINARVNNFGTINITGGELVVERFTNSLGGVINIGTGTTLRKTAGVTLIPVNFGTININGGTFSSTGTVENRGAINFTGNGTITLGAHSLRNFGSINTAAGQINLVSPVVITNVLGASITANNGTLNIISPLVRNVGDITLIRSTGTFSDGAINTGSMLISGTTAAAHLNVGGVFTNAGTITFFRSVGTFNSAVVNSGAWITDPTTNIFNDTFTVTASGTIVADAGDVFIFRKDFVNLSRSNETWNTQNAALNTNSNGNVNNVGTKFLFEGDGNATQQFFHVGLNLTGGFVGSPATPTDPQIVTTLNVAGFSTNFALGTLELTNTFLMLSQSYPTPATNNALFVKNLFIGSTSALIISNNMTVYFINSNTWSLANVQLLGNASIHQLQLTEFVAIPEPSILLLLMVGGAITFVARRRKTAHNSSS
jgi:hypothetical protein